MNRGMGGSRDLEPTGKWNPINLQRGRVVCGLRFSVARGLQWVSGTWSSARNDVPFGVSGSRRGLAGQEPLNDHCTCLDAFNCQ